MKEYFECNLPHANEIPSIYQPDLMMKLMDTVELVHQRTNKLNAALKLSNLKPATFHVLAKKVFDISNVRFDSMDPKQLAALCQTIYDGSEADDRIEWPNTIVLYDTWFVTTKDWEALRHVGIGGSESSVLQGCNHYQTPEGLWYDKLGYPDKMVDASKKIIFDRGHFLEDRVVETFCKITGATRIPESRMFVSARYPHATANIDAIIRTVSGELAIFEAKTAVTQKKDDWRGSKIPPNYVTQMRQYPGVLNDDRITGVYIGMIPVGDIALDGTYIGSAYDTGEFMHHFIERDEAEEINVMEAEEVFWREYIEKNIKPDISRDPELDKAVANRYKETPLNTVDPDPYMAPFEANKELLEKLIQSEREFSELNKAVESAKKKRDFIRNEVTDQMGAKTLGQFVDDDGKSMVTIKNSVIHKETFDGKKLKEFFPDAYAACRKESSFNKFTMKVNY